MKEGWKVKKLGEITAKIGSGATPRGGNESYKTEGISLIRSMNVHDLEFRDKNLAFIDDNQAKELNNVALQENDVLLNITGASVARCCIVPKSFLPARVNQHVSIIRVKKEIIDPLFLNLLLTSKYYKDQLLFTGEQGATRQAITKAQIESFKIAFPKSLPEQQRIVSILDEAFTAIARVKENAERNLRNAREVFESYLQGVFEEKGEGWLEMTVGQVAKHSLGKMLDKNKNKGILQKYLRNQSVRWFEFDLTDLNEMPFLENEKDKYTAVKGDVLICEGGYPGRAAIWQEDYPIYFQKAIHRVRFHKPEYNKWFLYHLFLADKTGKLKEYFSGTGIQHFTREALSKYLIPLPPANKVGSIVQKLDTLSAETKKLEAIYQQKINDLEEMKKSILEKAFKGGL